MSSTSDSEDGMQMRFLEAADNTLLTNDLFQRQSIENTEKEEEEIANPTTISDPPSQRFTNHDANTGTDIHFPEAVQRHVSKKMADIINRQVEFCDLPQNEMKQKKAKSKVRLLSGADCYVNSYEEFEYDTKGPEKRPTIKRRKVDNETPITEDERLRSVAVTGQDIAEGVDLNSWAQRPERKGKVFRYKLGCTGMLHSKDTDNEFSQVRRKNKWNESKIKEKTK